MPAPFLATHWLEAGLPLFALKRMLGHNSLSTTSKYLHLSREFLAKVKSPLDKLYSQDGRFATRHGELPAEDK